MPAVASQKLQKLERSVFARMAVAALLSAQAKSAGATNLFGSYIASPAHS